MRRLLLVLILSFVALPAAAQADERYCWVDAVVDAAGRTIAVTRCRVAGEIVDYASEAAVPGVLYVAFGSAADGACWYWRSTFTGYVIVERYDDGTALLGVGVGLPGEPSPFGVYPVCTSEPVPESALALAWELASEYVHVAPDPVLNPQVPWGLTGAETFLQVEPPPPFVDQLVDPLGGTVEVTGRVIGVTVSWGDGHTATFTEAEFSFLSGFPDGLARHVYEVKTCDPPGAKPRCHATLSSYPLVVSYQWEVEWRDGAAPWAALPVPDTTATVAYPVKEVIAVLDASP